AVVAQERHDEFEFRVADVVALGRNPHKGTFDRDTDQDRAIILDAMERTGVSRFAGRVFATLSGGEKQRVLVARALAQQSAVLLLDEPTNHLDIRAQLDLLELVRGLGVTTIAALHDLNHASAYCDEVLVMAAGRTVAAGPPDAVLSPALLAEVFGVQAHGSIHAATGRYHLVFTPLPREVAT
ncbi:MAG: ABC transporter ATP-binding protein, partial [Chloroflexota bacterium]